MLPPLQAYRAPLGAARTIVERVLRASKTPLTTHQIYAAALQVKHFGSPNRPLPAHVPAEGPAAPTAPFPPHPEHPVRSISFLKHHVLPSMLNRKLVLPTKSKKTASTEQPTTPTDARRAQYAYIHAWIIAPPRAPPPQALTASQNEAIDADIARRRAELGLDEDLRHLNRSRLRARLAERSAIEHDLASEARVRKARVKAELREHAASVARLKTDVVDYSARLKQVARRTRATVGVLRDRAKLPAAAVAQLPRVEEPLTDKQRKVRRRKMVADGKVLAKVPDRMTERELKEFTGFLRQRKVGLRRTQAKARARGKMVKAAIEKAKVDLEAKAKAEAEVNVKAEVEDKAEAKATAEASAQAETKPSA